MSFVTGPVRSGKSTFAAALARRSGRAVVYVATAERDSRDAEWDARIARHIADRPADWRTIEMARLTAPEQIALLRNADPRSCLIVDALGTWLAQRVGREATALDGDVAAAESRIDAEARAFVEALLASPAEIVAVGEQVGWDVVPPTASGRVFRDVMGRMAQRLGRGAERVFLVAAGYAVDLRALGTPVDA